jgi:hypothetical protein
MEILGEVGTDVIAYNTNKMKQKRNRKKKKTKQFAKHMPAADQYYR